MHRTWMIPLALSFAFVACPALPLPPERTEDPTLNTFTSSPSIAGCPILPENNVWNTPVDHLPVDPNSSAYVASIGANERIFTDFGSGLKEGGLIGFPFVVVKASQPRVQVTFEYASESDPGTYPIPPDAPIEGGVNHPGDRHVIVLDSSACKLYELFYAFPERDGSWRAGSGAVFDLRSNRMRPRQWTSADAAGLPILPGLVRYEEVKAGSINHALRFTAVRTRKAYVWPARHHAGESFDPNLPPLGQRFRLKASFDTSRFPRDIRIILEALKTYGMILADNGGNWGVSGAPSEGWDNDLLWRSLAGVKGSDFEAVDSSSLISNADWADAKQPPEKE